MKTLFKVLAVILMLTGSLPSSAQEKIIYPLPVPKEGTLNLWGYAYNYDRKRLVIDYMFENANQFGSYTGLAQVVKDGYCGAIDINGNFVIEPIYDEIIYQPYSNTFIVELDGKRGEMNIHGELIKPIEYENLWSEQKKGWYGFTVGEDYYYIAPDGHVTSDWSEYLNAPFEEWEWDQPN